MKNEYPIEAIGHDWYNPPEDEAVFAREKATCLKKKAYYKECKNGCGTHDENAITEIGTVDSSNHEDLKRTYFKPDAITWHIRVDVCRKCCTQITRTFERCNDGSGTCSVCGYTQTMQSMISSSFMGLDSRSCCRIRLYLETESGRDYWFYVYCTKGIHETIQHAK